MHVLCLLLATHLLLAFLMHKVELVETEETKGQDYQDN